MTLYYVTQVSLGICLGLDPSPALSVFVGWLESISAGQPMGFVVIDRLIMNLNFAETAECTS